MNKQDYGPWRKPQEQWLSRRNLVCNLVSARLRTERRVLLLIRTIPPNGWSSARPSPRTRADAPLAAARFIPTMNLKPNETPRR
jgi:hypothetical protein